MVRVEMLSSSRVQRVYFLFTAREGHKVFLTGSFNDWEPEMAEMVYSEAAGGYEIEIELPPGGYEYKFVVDGDWLADADNPNFSANDFGTLNSVLNIG